MNEPSNYPKDKTTGPRNAWPLLVAVVLVAVLAGGAVVFFGGNAAQQEQAAGKQGRADGGGPSPSAALGHPALGNEDAPVTMIEYSDFQCPFCGKFARETEPALIKKYVEDGTLRIEWRDFPYLGQESVNAALAARAAEAQGKFWEYHDLLYENQGSGNSGAFSDENLTGFAEELGLDAERFESDLRSEENAAAVAEDFRQGQGQGISGTPTFVVNGHTLVGAQPVEVYERAIEEAAREARGG